MELEYLLPHQVDKFIDPDLGPVTDNNILRIADAFSEISDSAGFKAVLHMIAIQYRDVLERLAAPYCMDPAQVNLLKGRLWGLSEILDLPGALTDRAIELKEKAKANPSTGGGR